MFLLVSFFTSCEGTKRFFINGKREYVVSTECGEILISGSTFTGQPLHLGFMFKGKYHIMTDSLKIAHEYNDVKVSDMKFQFNHEEIRDKEFDANPGEPLLLTFGLKYGPTQRAGNTLLILPSNFITCEGKQIITDTLRLQLTFKNK